MSIVLHPLWPLLSPHLVVRAYDKDGGHVDPRIRIEFCDLPAELATAAADAIMKCVTCRARIFPLRQRIGDPWSRLYYAPSCSLEQNIACSRSPQAHVEYERFKTLGAELEARRPAAQMRMF